MSPKILNNAFNIAEAPYWSNNDIFSPERVDKILERIKCNCELLRNQSQEDDFWKGTVQNHFENYLKECISGECNESSELTEQMVEDILQSKSAKKIQNLDRAAKTMFPDILSLEPSPMEGFNVNYVQKLHEQVGRKVIPNAGKFRTKSAKPAGENFYYVEPRLIEQKLEILLRECREVFSNTSLDFRDAVKYAACFLVEFLFIHPFPNGNGRVGRLLLSHLLRQYTVVPLPLYSSGRGRENYLCCLREAREPYTEAGKPASLARFIVENIDKAFRNLKYMMDL